MTGNLRATAARVTVPPYRLNPSQAIPDAGLGDDVPGLGRVVFELLPQMPHEHPQVVRALGMRGPPHLAQRMPVGQHPARIGRQHPEQPVLDRREMHLTALPAHDARREIDLDLAETEQRADSTITGAPDHVRNSRMKPMPSPSGNPRSATTRSGRRDADGYLALRECRLRRVDRAAHDLLDRLPLDPQAASNKARDRVSRCVATRAR